MRWLMKLLLAGTIVTPVGAHDFWLQPQGWQVAQGVVLPVWIEVGHAEFREHFAGKADRLITLSDIGQTATSDLRAFYRAGGTEPQLATPYRQKGPHILTMSTTQALSALPALRFNDYIKAEGITPALEYRIKTKTTEAPGRERYSRRCKALIQVGANSSKDDKFFTRNIGMTLEIVPQISPYNLDSSRTLPIKVYYEGKPLSGAFVKLTNLEFDAKALQTARTDSNGHTQFHVPPLGSWLVSVIWTKHVVANDADFETVFSSLTFGYSPKHVH